MLMTEYKLAFENFLSPCPLILNYNKTLLDRNEMVMFINNPKNYNFLNRCNSKEWQQISKQYKYTYNTILHTMDTLLTLPYSPASCSTLNPSRISNHFPINVPFLSILLLTSENMPI
jgi:hypothetical protein